MPPTSTSRATAAATATVFCFAAKTSQDLNGTISVSVEQRPELCGVFCKSLLYPYFGVSWSRECYCGTSFGSLGRSVSVRYQVLPTLAISARRHWLRKKTSR